MAHTQTASKAANSPVLGPAVHLFGILLLIACAGLSLVLVMDHFNAMNLPGCGPQSACARAANSVWGKIPLGGERVWPVSFVGFAYFVGVFVAWLMSKGGVSRVLKNLIRLGAAASVGFIAVMVMGGYVCQYCLATHIANIAFWALVEVGARGARPVGTPIGAWAAGFVVVSAVLLVVESRQTEAITEQREQDLAESIEKIAAASQNKDDSAGQGMTLAANDSAGARTTNGDPGDTPSAGNSTTGGNDTPSEPSLPDFSNAERPWKGGFTGRYRLGPEKAPIRLVMITDYQCPDCRRIEAEARAMMNERNDVSLSIKHFPMCTDCNRHFQERNMHPNACWAARAAEAAGILRGDEGFFEMHHWLFDVKGTFTNQTLPDSLRAMGYDPQEFMRVMMSDETEQRVKADIEEAIWLGVFYTPMIFINGVELSQGKFAKNAVPRAVEQIAKTHPPAMTCANDQPPPALAKYIRDWQEGPRFAQHKRNMRPHVRGPDDAPVSIIVWGDYEEPTTARVDGLIREIVERRKGQVQYTYRHFPFNEECNAHVKSSPHELACTCALLTEAAITLTEDFESFWLVHDWLLANQEGLTNEKIDEGLKSLGYDPEVLRALTLDKMTKMVVTDDTVAARMAAARQIPWIVINDRHLPRWIREGQPVFDLIIDAALVEAEEAPPEAQAAPAAQVQ